MTWPGSALISGPWKRGGRCPPSFIAVWIPTVPRAPARAPSTELSRTRFMMIPPGPKEERAPPRSIFDAGDHDRDVRQGDCTVAAFHGISDRPHGIGTSTGR